MGPQGKLVGSSTTRYTSIPGSDLVDQNQASSIMGGKERLLSSNGSVSGSPGRMADNVSRDSGIGCLKVKANLQ